jgi:aryl-alcohol dehydrogenase-like predicted oxidoreductase
MRYRRFGNTDLEVSEICYGTMRYASKTGELDDVGKAGRRALEAAIDRGVNFVHSSYEYGTRWLTSQVLAEHPKRHELHHIIKVNVPDWGDEGFDEEMFRKQIHEALEELHTDRIAVVQHLQRGTLPRSIGYNAEGEPKRLAEFDAVVHPLREAFDRLHREGKVGYLTTFPYTVGYAEKAVESGLFSGLVAYFNCLETELMDLFPAMEEKGMGFIGIRPLAAGLLTQRRVDRDRLGPEDRQHDESWNRLYDQLGELRSALDEEPEDWTDFAIRFSLAPKVAASTVLGINRTDQLEAALAAVEGPEVSPEALSAAHELTKKYRESYGVQGLPSGLPVYAGAAK